MTSGKSLFADVTAELIAKYAGSVPRYTSYPTAVEFSNAVDGKRWREILSAEGDGTGSVYIHVPYCRSLCYFCACNKVIASDRGGVRPYLDAVKRELELYGDILKGKKLELEQIHWGGGSPNFLEPEEMVELHAATRAVFPSVSADADISVELDPRTTTTMQLDALSAAGFNRLSLGVQDFDEEVQEAVNRYQSFEMTRDLCRAGRERGFGGVNIDLIYGLPAQTKHGFLETIERVLEIRPDRIALYGYAHVTWLHKVQKSFHRFRLPSPGERIEIFLHAIRRFTEAGYEHIGLDHFALPTDSLCAAKRSGKLNRNFMGYTTHRGARIFAFGPSAVSSVERAFVQNIKGVPEYLSRAGEGKLAVERGLVRSDEDILRGEIIEEILCRGGFQFETLGKRFGVDLPSRFARELSLLEEFTQDGLLEREGAGVRLTPVGRLFARNIAATFDSYLVKHREKTVFSQAV